MDRPDWLGIRVRSYRVEAFLTGAICGAAMALLTAGLCTLLLW